MKSKKGPKRRPEGTDNWVAGPNSVTETLRAKKRAVYQIWATDSTLQRREDLRQAAEAANVRLEPSTNAALDERFTGIRHQGVVAEVAPYPYLSMESLPQQVGDTPSLILALDQITDPHNFGAIVRSAVAFGVSAVLITKDRCADVNATTVRTSAGATEHASIARVTNLSRALKSLQGDGYEVVGLAGEGQTLIGELRRDRPRVLVVGSEGSGLRRLTRERCDTLVRIPIDGSVSSLNASVAAAVALYALGTP